MFILEIMRRYGDHMTNDKEKYNPGKKKHVELKTPVKFLTKMCPYDLWEEKRQNLCVRELKASNITVDSRDNRSFLRSV